MPKTRLFHTLIVCGAALTGGPIATAAVATAATVGATVAVAAIVSGCDTPMYNIIDMPIVLDMTQPSD